MNLKDIFHIQQVTITQDGLSLPEFWAVVRGRAKVSLDESVVSAMSDSHGRLDQMVKDNVHIYGVTTGFGSNVQYRITPEEAAQLQKNLLRTHAVSVGKPCTEEETRAIILMILLNLSTGYTGADVEIAERLAVYLNEGFYPFAPSDGSVGYLAVEGHIALTLIGEGYFLEKDNGQEDAGMEIEGYRKVSAASFLKRKKLAPISLSYKEGLSLISGTTSATALGLMALLDFAIAYCHIELADTIAFETLHATDLALDARIHELKKYPEQSEAAERMRRILEDSEICRTWRYEKVQDAYILRAMPQIHGAILRTFREVEECLTEEMHSCSDNPVILPDGSVLMTGNFDGTFLAEHEDHLAVAAAKMAVMSERVTDRLVNFHINDGLPPYLAKEPGICNGFMILQYTQAALAAEVKLLAVPASVDSITTCAGQEDPVSMDYRAGQKAYEAAGKLKKMASIELLTAFQAMYLRGETEKAAPVIRECYKLVREGISPVDYDRYLYADMEEMDRMVESLELLPDAVSGI